MKTDNTCCCVVVVIGVALFGALLAVFYVNKSATELTELKQVHIVFSEGQRTPMMLETEYYPLSIHRNETYYPYGYNALTNDGKVTMFKTGEMLRNIYDDFLTKLYRQEELFMLTSDTDISKMSGLLVLAGLWPIAPEQKWTELNWQPIPYKSSTIDEDIMLFDMNCPRYIQEKYRITEIFTQNTLSPYDDIFLRLTLLTGRNITTPLEVLKLSNLLRSQEQMKMKNPKWYRNMKKSIRELVRMEYSIMFRNKLLQKLSAGPLLEKILIGSKKRIEQVRVNEKGIKIIMYSATMKNVASILTATRIAKPNQPRYGSAFIIELHHKKTSNDYAFKLYVWEPDLPLPTLVKLPKCDGLCPIGDFEKILQDISVTDYTKECEIIK